MRSRSIYTKHAQVSVSGHTDTSSLPPVCLVVAEGRMRYQDYLTPEKARELGKLLIATADAVEEHNAPSSLDEAVDRKMANLKFIEVAAPEAVTA